MKKFAIIINFEEKQCIWTKNTESLRVMSDENQPLLGGEHYLTDRELSQRLKISRRTLQDYRNNGILPYRQLGGKTIYRGNNIKQLLQRLR